MIDREYKKKLLDAGLTKSDITILYVLKKGNYKETIGNSKYNKEYREYMEFTGGY